MPDEYEDDGPNQEAFPKDKIEKFSSVDETINTTAQKYFDTNQMNHNSPYALMSLEDIRSTCKDFHALLLDSDKDKNEILRKLQAALVSKCFEVDELKKSVETLNKIAKDKFLSILNPNYDTHTNDKNTEFGNQS